MSVATSTAIGLGVAAGTAVAGGIAAHETGKSAEAAATTTSTAADKAAQIQADATNKAAELQAQAAQESLDYTKQQSALSLAQYNTQQQRLQPYRNLGNFAMGLPPSAAPDPLVMPTIPGTSPTTPTSNTTMINPGGTPMATTSGAPGATDPVQSYLLSQVQSGVSPQQAATSANQKFGLQSGGGAVYYPDTNTIGMPSFYLAGPQGGGAGTWNVVQRQGGGGGSSSTTNNGSLLASTQATMAGTPTIINPTTPGGQPAGYNSLAQLGGF